MDPIGRVVMGGLAVGLLWTLLRAAQTGMLYSRGYTLDATRNPSAFLLDVLARTGLVLFCTALAAGYTKDELWRFALRLLALLGGH